jgi:hypothetical protein
MKKLMKRAEQEIRKSYSAWYKTRFHFREKNFAGVQPLSEEQKKAIAAFWKPFPCHYKMEFLQYYCHFSGNQDYYIPDDVWYNVILPYYNNKTLAQQIDDKCLYDIFLKNFSVPQSVLRIIDNRIYDNDYHTLDCDRANEIIHGQESDLIIKPSMASSGGVGVKRLSDLPWSDVSEIRKEYPNAIIQKMVKQSECLNRLNGSSLNTIRITSLILRDGSLVIPSAIMRMGANGSIVDNVCAGGVFAGIDIAAGCLKKYGFSRATGQYVKYTAHPNSGIVFENYKIDGFSKIVEAVKNNARYLPKTRLLGWDFTLDTKNEPVMIEVNIEDHEVEVMQLANGPYFGSRELATKVLAEVFEGENRCPNK